MLCLNVQILPLFLWHFVPQSSALSGDLGKFLVRITSITTLLQQSFVPMDQAKLDTSQPFLVNSGQKKPMSNFIFQLAGRPPPPTCGLAFLSRHPLD
jgi:hypothetical protein